MPSISQIADTVTAMFRKSPKVVPMIHGAPGMGKSDVCLQIAVYCGFPAGLDSLRHAMEVINDNR